MDGKQVETVARVLIERQSRRGAVQLLGAALLGGAGLLALGGETDAKPRPSRKQGGTNERKPKASDRCRRGKVVQRVQVPGDGTAVLTKSLAKGETYRLRVSGYVEDAEWGLDGEYYFLRADPTNTAEVYDACFDDTPVGVEVSGVAFFGWGTYAADHVYERTVTGKGQPLSLRLSDCIYSGNIGSLKVEILCG